MESAKWETQKTFEQTTLYVLNGKETNVLDAHITHFQTKITNANKSVHTVKLTINQMVNANHVMMATI